jgi:hypothetical protein
MVTVMATLSVVVSVSSQSCLSRKAFVLDVVVVDGGGWYESEQSVSSVHTVGGR